MRDANINCPNSLIQKTELFWTHCSQWRDMTLKFVMLLFPKVLKINCRLQYESIFSKGKIEELLNFKYVWLIKRIARK